jgi:hypothetical protein
MSSWYWNLPWRIYSYSSDQEIPCFYGTRRFITVFTKPIHLTLYRSNSAQFTPSHFISLRSIYPIHSHLMYEGVSKSFRTGRLERKLQMVQLSATRCICIAILWASLVSFAALTLCIASHLVFLLVSIVMTQSGNFWIPPRMSPKWFLRFRFSSQNTDVYFPMYIAWPLLLIIFDLC